MKKALKVCDYIVSFLFSFLFILVSAFISIIPIASNNAYYMLQFEKNGVGENLNYSIEQLDEITKAITNYMFHGAKSMQVYFDNEPVFSPQAISHMADVKVLFVGGTILGYISLGLLVFATIYLAYRHKSVKKIFRKITYITFLVFLLMVIAMTIYALVDFDSAFTNFHHILFPDPEKFNNAFFPDDDTLINILTLDFFFDIFIEVIIRIVAIYTVFIFIVQCLYGKIFKHLKSIFISKFKV